jgi:hypothetical protein
MKFGFKKIITLLIIVLIAYPNVTKAQFLNGGMGASAQGGFNLQGIAGVVASCANIAGAISNAASSLFDSVVVSNVSNAVPVTDSVVRSETKQQNFKERCLDALARYAVLKVIDKITLMTVEWINSGFEGNPFYPENRANFFEEIARDEVLTFTSWFSANPQDYPFGQAVAETILLSVQNRFQDNLRFSLNQVLQHSNQYANYDSFTAQFSIGGWAGYTAMMEPSNNIFGNYLMANNYLARQTRGTTINIAENFRQELSEGLGVINQRKCARTAMSDSYYSSGDEYIDETNDLHLGGYPLIPAGGTMTGSIYLSLPPVVQDYLDNQNGTDAQAAEYNALVRRSTCVSWRTVTPGRFIAEQTTQALGSPLRNLELGDELNENLGLIFDALLNQLVQQGLNAFYNSSGYSSNPTDPNYNAIWAQNNNQDFGNQSQQPTVNEAINGNGSNNLGLIDIQQQYLLQATETVETLNTLIRDIRVLDYCIPGPNPRWYENANINMQNTLAGVAPQSGGSAWIYYTNIVNGFTGVNLFSNGSNGGVNSHPQFLNFMTYLLDSYRNAMYLRYSLNLPPPSVRPAAAGLYNQIPTYQSTISALENNISSLISAIPQLQYIQSQINALTPAEQANQNNPTVQSMTSLLAQLSSQGVLVTQSQLENIVESQLGYESLSAASNDYINQCIAEVTSPTYAGGNERVAYPFSSITTHPLFSQIPQPTNVFLGGETFGDSAGEIDLSGYLDLQLEVPSVSVEQFANFLEALY